MSLTGLVINQIIIMFLLIITGFLCFRFHLITAEVNKNLSALVLKLINPVLIFTSYNMEFKIEYLNGLAITFLLAVASHLIAILLAQGFIRNPQRHDVPVERFTVIYSNCGFMGIPLINGLFGSQGVFYLTTYIAVFNILVWTHGVILMKGKSDARHFMNAVKTPAIIATILGLILFVSQLALPKVLLSALNYVGSMNTPMAMLVAGATIAQTDILKSFLKVRNYYIAAIKLLVVPLAVLLLLRLFPIDHTILLTVVVASACPAATTGTLFALRYGKNSLYASELFAVSTILSIATLPLLIFIAGLL